MNQYLEKKHQSVPPDYYEKGIKSNPFQRFWHKKRFTEVEKFLKKIKAKRVLDVGCHGGKFTSIVSESLSKAKIFGIDISREAISYADKKYPMINFVVARAEHLPFENSSFDLVTCFEVLEHLENPALAIKEINRILKGSGHFLALVPTENILFRTIWFFWSNFGPGKVWQNTHLQKFADHKLDMLLKEFGFRTIRRKTFLLGMLLLIQSQKI